MACGLWAGKLDAYVDGELPPAEERALREHLRGCASCAADSVELLPAGGRPVTRSKLWQHPGPPAAISIGSRLWLQLLLRCWQWLRYRSLTIEIASANGNL